MREQIINFLKRNPRILSLFWKTMALALKMWALFLPIDEKRIVFASFGGRRCDDSPKALYDEICSNDFFDDWKLVWAFVEPDKINLPRGSKVRIDTLEFFKILLSSKVWISNSGMARGIDIHRKGIVEVETWHGTPLKKIGGEEHENSMAPDRAKTIKKGLDSSTIRCAQSEYDRNIFARIFHADKDAILLCDLPRNDSLTKYSESEKQIIRTKLRLPLNKKVILYTPTYREYLVDSQNNTYIAPPINLEKWRRELSSEFVLLFRAHYSVRKSLDLKNDGFIIDATDYTNINDLYAISDLMISDYSSTYFDYSILDKPILCFAYDLTEYEEKRGLYLNLAESLPCPIDDNEDMIIRRIQNMDYEQSSAETRRFHLEFAPHSGNASKTIVEEIIKRCKGK